MKNILKFLQTTLAGGLLFLVPIIVFFVIIKKSLDLARQLVNPLAEKLPYESVLGLHTPMLMAVALVVLFCFFAGFFARTMFAQKIVNSLEGSVLSNIPGYQLIKGVGESILGVEETNSNPVVMVRLDDAWQIAFQIEVLPNGLITVFVPDAPNPNAGAILFVAADRVTLTTIPPSTGIKLMKRLGAGAGKFLPDFKA